jgi:hypothetical protein
LAPIAHLAEDIPAGSRVTCFADEEAVYLRHSLVHNCNGLLTFLTGGYTGGGFADTDYNAIRFRPGHPLPALNHSSWQQSPALLDWDYVVVRGQHAAPPESRAVLVRTEDPPGSGAEPWTLYRVIHPERVTHSFMANVGSGVGAAPQSDCPPHAVVTGMAGSLSEHGIETVVSAVPRCSPLRRAEGELSLGRPLGGRVELGARGGNAIRLECPESLVAVGLYGGAGALLDRVGLLCAPLQLEASDRVTRTGDEPVRSLPAGGQGGQDFVLTCPADSALVGLRGSMGVSLDGIGISCEPVASLLGTQRPEGSGEAGAPEGSGSSE